MSPMNMNMIRFEDLLLWPNTLLSMTLWFTRNICRNKTKAESLMLEEKKRSWQHRCIKEKQNLTLPDINCKKLTALLRNQQRTARQSTNAKSAHTTSVLPCSPSLFPFIGWPDSKRKTIRWPVRWKRQIIPSFNPYKPFVNSRKLTLSFPACRLKPLP